MVWIIFQELGIGSYAVVRKCVHKASGIEYAVKIIDQSKKDATEEVEVCNQQIYLFQGCRL